MRCPICVYITDKTDALFLTQQCQDQRRHRELAWVPPDTPGDGMGVGYSGRRMPYHHSRQIHDHDRGTGRVMHPLKGRKCRRDLERLKIYQANLSYRPHHDV